MYAVPKKDFYKFLSNMQDGINAFLLPNPVEDTTSVVASLEDRVQRDFRTFKEKFPNEDNAALKVAEETALNLLPGYVSAAQNLQRKEKRFKPFTDSVIPVTLLSLGVLVFAPTPINYLGAAGTVFGTTLYPIATFASTEDWRKYRRNFRDTVIKSYVEQRHPLGW